MIAAGELRHVVEIQDYTTAGDGDASKVFGEGSQAFAVVRARIRTLRGSELFAAQTQFPEATSEIKIRYLAGVNEGMRVKHVDPRSNLTTYYDILNVNDVERRGFEMLLTCSSGVSATK